MSELLQNVVGDQIELISRPSTSLWPVEADPTHIQQVIMNLAINARDAMPDGGSLRIETANVELDESFVNSHPDARSGPHVKLTVTDTGTGMDEDTLSHVFEPFYTTKEVGKGTGLGLATVHGIVNRTGGSIWVYSELGEGTSFKVYIPQTEKEVNWRPARLEPAEETAQGGSETILLVEDDPAILRLAERVLTAHGYQVLAASTPHEALSLTASTHETIDLLLTDVMMPGMDGAELAAKLTEAHSSPAKILFMSGYSREHMTHNARLDSGASLLEKPFSTDTLAREVRRVLDEA